ncbi:MAG: glycosyltransferase, partial [Acidimicrobiales bacterium]
LAVRRSTFESIGGFDEGFGIGGYEDDDLCARIRESGQRLLITHGSFVHHHGHRTFDANGLDWHAIQQENAQLFHAKRGAEAESRADDRSAPMLVSACLIVKDEQAILGDCLSSLEGLVDEIVVYDTGSTDGTIELARQAGAKVIEGYWDDNFGRARNAALEHCTGQWILHIDADEIIVADVRATRDLLRNPATDDAILVVIDNLAPGRTGGMQHKACRLFRRVRGQWMGRLHEQVVARPGQPPLPRGDIEHLRIIHSGYLPELVEKRNKGERNTKLAEAELATDKTSDRSLLVFNLARSLAFAGRHEEAIERCREAKKPGGLLTVRRAAMRFGAELLLSSGRPTEALEWVGELRPLTDHPAVCDYLEGSARLFLGEHERALELLSSLDDIWDDDGISINSDTVLTRKGLALVAAGVWLEGADALLEVVQRQPVSNAWGPLVVAQWHAGRRFDEIVALLPDEQMRAVLAQMMFIIADAADSFANALWERFPRDPRLLGFAAHHAPRLDTPGCLEWASRLRSGGLSQHCPLIARAGAEHVGHDRRLQAAAVAVGAFADERADGIVARLAPTVTADLFPAVLIELDELAPSLLPTFITHAATNAERCEAMADALEELGADEQAQAIRMHAERIVA